VTDVLEGKGGDGTQEAVSLEARLRRLEEIVAALEADGVPLDRALALFEEGVGHLRRAERLLTEAELRVEELIGRGDVLETRPFQEEAE
jgi:exodeoxyribonuclease VII small subunit